MNVELKTKKIKVKRCWYNPPVDSLINVKTAEASYLLGFLWADGYLRPSYKSETSGMIGLEIITKDFLDIENILLDVSNLWKINKNLSMTKTIGKDGVNRKPQAIVHLCNSLTYLYLKEMNYKNKKILSCDKILNTIPVELQHYWWRGFFDGDGCIYFNHKQRTYQATISGHYEQNWDCYDKLLTDLEINHSLRRVVGKRGNYSQMRICSKSGCLKLMSYLYQGQEMGLKRKYIKFKTLYDYSINKDRILKDNGT
jgi:hypothetical protein